MEDWFLGNRWIDDDEDENEDENEDVYDDMEVYL